MRQWRGAVFAALIAVAPWSGAAGAELKSLRVPDAVSVSLWRRLPPSSAVPYDRYQADKFDAAARRHIQEILVAEMTGWRVTMVTPFPLNGRLVLRYAGADDLTIDFDPEGCDEGGVWQSSGRYVSADYPISKRFSREDCLALMRVLRVPQRLWGTPP